MRLRSLVGTLAIVVAACGGGATATTIFPSDGQSPLDTRLVDAANTLIDRWDDRHAFYAVMAALDAGYTAEQVISAAADLFSDGSIPGVEPGGEPGGLLSSTGPGGELSPQAVAVPGDTIAMPSRPRVRSFQSPDTPADQYVEDVGSWLSDVWDVGQKKIAETDTTPIRDAATEASIAELEFIESVTFNTLELALVGYSPGQIIEGILSFSVTYVGFCAVIAGPDGRPVTPDGEFLDQRASEDCFRAFEDGDSSSVTSTSASVATTPATSTTETASGDYSFDARADDFVLWEGSFSIVGGELVGSGTLTGGVDDTCGIEGGTRHPVAYSLSGTYDITGTAGESTMFLILRPTGGNVDVSVGDTSQLCVEITIDLAHELVAFPLGDVDVGGLPIEVPIGGGSTSLDYGFVIQVMVSPN